MTAVYRRDLDPGYELNTDADGFGCGLIPAHRGVVIGEGQHVKVEAGGALE